MVRKAAASQGVAYMPGHAMMPCMLTPGCHPDPEVARDMTLLERELVAELASLESLLGDISASRVLERRGLEGRSRRLRQRLAELRGEKP